MTLQRAECRKHQSFQPFAFLTNGRETYFWDVDRETNRQVAGFFSLSDLENLLYLSQNKIALQTLGVNIAIAGRAYQQEAIRRVCERFDEGFRRALLVMATGTGKTRTTMALIDLFLQANQARVDVPEIVNLVFMKPVQSQITLRQMIGRGTRNDETCKYRSRDGCASGNVHKQDRAVEA